MAYKSQEFEFHLTPVGWTTNEIAPTYTVETWRLAVYQEFSWSKEQRSWSRVWYSLAWSEVERDRLRQTFPPPAKISPVSVAQPLTAAAGPNEHRPSGRAAAR
jgi:hypothetical protein